MNSLETLLNHHLTAAFETAGYPAPDLATVRASQRPDLCQFQCNGAMAAAGRFNVSPRQIAEQVVDQLKQHPEVFSKLEVAGPGFVNFNLQDQFLAEHTNLTIHDRRLGCAQTPTNETIIIDYGGPNVAKPLHVGHLRASIIGESLKRLYRYIGYTVFGDVHLGDWGTPMGIIIAMIEEEQPDLPYFDVNFAGPYPSESPVTIEDLERLYPLGSTRTKEDDTFRIKAQQATYELQNGRPGYYALWLHFVSISIDDLRSNFNQLNVTFDWWYGESHYHNRIGPMIDRLKEQGLAQESEGALIIPLPTIENKEIPPLLLIKSDGAYLYSTTDLATIEERVQDNGANRILYVVDQRQSLHFTQVFAAARKINIAPEHIILEHLGFGTVNGKDGKPFKTRAGGVMKLMDLINECTDKAREKMLEAGIGKDYPEKEQQQIAEMVGVAALKYADLSNNRLSDYIFDIDKFTSFDGQTGPYLLYTAVRIKSIFRKLQISDKQISSSVATDPTLAVERNIMLTAAQFPTAISETIANNTPHVLCEFIFKLAQEYNRFYQQCSIMHEEDETRRNSWISLSNLVLRELETALDLLGIKVPDRM